MTHQLHKSSDHPDGHDENCFICQGGLSLCNVCGGAEATLPTDCPGEPMTESQRDRVQAGEIDFVTGDWVEL